MMKKTLLQCIFFLMGSAALIGEWSTPININTTPFTSSSFPSSILNRYFSMSPNGYQAVVMVDPSTTNLLAATRKDNQSWSSLFQLNVGGTDVHLPKVVMDGSGNAIALWAINHGAGLVLETRQWDSATGNWGSLETVASAPSLGAYDIAMDVNGNATTLWANGVVFPNLFFSQRPLSGTWGAPQSLALLAVDSSASVSMDSLGNTLVATSQSPTNLIAVATIHPDGTSTAFTIFASSSDASSFPFGAVDPNGNAVVIWGNSGTNEIQVISGNIQTNTWELSPTNLPTTPSLFASFWMAVIDGSGTATVIWNDSVSGSNSSIKVASKTLSGVWEAPTTISTTPTNFNAFSWLAVNNLGKVSAIWLESDLATFSSIDESTKEIGGNWSLPVVITQAAGFPPINFPFEFQPPLIGLDDVGNAAAIWPFLSSAGTAFAQSSYNLTLLPPTHLIGQQVKNRYLKQTDLVNVLSWNPPLLGSSDVVAYRISRNGQVIATVPANGPLVYRDHNRMLNVIDIYDIQAVASNGSVSSAISITIP